MDQPHPGPTDREFGALEQNVKNLGETVKSLSECIDKQEVRQEARHNTQMSRQSELFDKVFAKFDDVNGQSHEAPCPILSSVAGAVGKVGDKVEAVKTDLGKVKTKISNIKTAGLFTWKTIVISCVVFAFFLTAAISILALIF